MAESRGWSFPMAEWELFSHDRLFLSLYWSLLPAGQLPDLKLCLPDTYVQKCWSRTMVLNSPVMNSLNLHGTMTLPMWQAVPVTPAAMGRRNGPSERAVRTVKSLLAKEGDFHKALLAYRATPLAHGSSPAQLQMGRRIRTPVPVSPEQLQPQWPDLDRFREKDTALKLQQQQTFNQRHRTQTLPPLQPGQHVWMKPTSTKGTVVSTAPTPHSYEVETPDGRRLRRTHSHLRKVPVPPAPVKWQWLGQGDCLRFLRD